MTGVDEKGVSSSERCLAESLILLVKKDVGSEKLWLLPQIQWQTGEEHFDRRPNVLLQVFQVHKNLSILFIYTYVYFIHYLNFIICVVVVSVYWKLVLSPK